MGNADCIWLDDKIAPGPDYRLYLTPKYVETGVVFQHSKAHSTQIGLVKALEDFSLNLPDGGGRDKLLGCSDLV